MKIRNGGGLNYPYFMLPDGDTEKLFLMEEEQGLVILILYILKKEDISILSSKELLKK